MSTRILPAALSLLLAACGDPAIGSDGRLTGRFEDVSWSGDARLETPPGVGPILQSEHRSQGSVRNIGVKIPHTAPGSYEIPAQGAWYSAHPLSGGDAYTASATGGTLAITRITEDYVAGRVEITFRGLGGETLRFTEGDFVAPLAHRRPRTW